MDNNEQAANSGSSGKHPVCWIDFSYSDWEQSAPFYKEVFGWVLNPYSDTYNFFEAPAGLMGGFNKLNLSEGKCPVVYLSVPNVEEWMERVVAAGGTKLSDKLVIDAVSGRGAAYFRDPSGVVMGLSDFEMPAQSRATPFGDGEKPKPNSICHVEIYGSDFANTGRFYNDLFGWQTKETMPQYMDFDPGNGISGIFQSHTPVAACVAYVYVEDVQKTLDRIARLGGKQMGEPMKLPGFGTFGYFTDPNGMALGLIGP